MLKVFCRARRAGPRQNARGVVRSCSYRAISITKWEKSRVKVVPAWKALLLHNPWILQLVIAIGPKVGTGPGSRDIFTPPKWQPRLKSGTPKTPRVKIPALSFLTPNGLGTGGVHSDPRPWNQLGMDRSPTCKRLGVKPMPGMHKPHPP